MVLLEGADGGGSDGALDAVDGAGVVAEFGEDGLDFAGAPVVFAVGLGVEGFPHGGVAGDDGVDGFGAAAGEAFVVFVVADGVGVAEDGEGSVGAELVELA